MEAGKISSWEHNFHSSLERILNNFKLDSDGYLISLDKMDVHFWSRFNDASELKPFKEEKFFSDLANSALECMVFETGKSTKALVEECFELGKIKNRDYGSDNILIFGTLGLIVRIGDKLRRLNALKTRRAEVREKIIDTLMDIFNYAVFGSMLSKDIWF